MLDQLTNLVTGVFSTTDEITLGIMVVIVILTGLLMGSIAQIINFTLGALVLFAAALVARAIIMDKAEPMALAEQRWNAFLGLSMGEFLVYFVAFALVILGVFLVKSLFRRA